MSQTALSAVAVVCILVILWILFKIVKATFRLLLYLLLFGLVAYLIWRYFPQAYTFILEAACPA
ncbi:MAG: hypothetical protein LBC63_04235 [Holophagales bacterium]|jgi:hypothetical protein|nr:hypothetical protein [Holophagales bacterium]